MENREQLQIVSRQWGEVKGNSLNEVCEMKGTRYGMWAETIKSIKFSMFDEVCENHTNKTNRTTCKVVYITR